MGSALPYQELPSNTEEKKHEPLKFKENQFKLHVAIDFGTDGCGIGFAYQDKVIIYNKWRGQTSKSNSKATTRKKTKTQLLLNDKNKVTCFGNAAKFMYYNIENAAERKGKKFFEKFKMALFEEKIGRVQDIIEADNDNTRGDVNTEQYLYAAGSDQKVEAKIVFVAAFQQLQAKAKEFIPKNVTEEKITDDEIQWIVTVPAIWSQKAKDSMKRWITEAGLVKANILNQCVIVYEPDCASLSIQRQFFKDEYVPKKYSGVTEFNPTDDDPEDDNVIIIDDEKGDEKFEEDDKYILIDAGGGTVDIACHKIRTDGSVEEIVYPTGGKWGSSYIDELFVKLLEKMFGKEFMDNYRDKNPANVVEVMEQFELAKKSFYRHKNSKSPHRIKLPNDFMSSLYEKYEELKEEPQKIVDEFAKNNKLKDYRDLFGCMKDVKCDEYDADDSTCVLRLIREKNVDEDGGDSDDSSDENNDYQYIKYLEMDVKIWKALFDSKINPIISHVVKLLNMEVMKHCKYLGLVGGFSCSKYFQERMKDTFGVFSNYTMNIIVPNKPMLSVVEGASYMAITQDYIRARKLPCTYGVCLRVTKEDAVGSYGMSEAYVKNNTEKDGMVKGSFVILARKNERIGVNEVRTQESLRTGKTHSRVPIYMSEFLNPITQDDGKQLAIMQPRHFDGHRLNITEFHFYGTMLKVYSYPKSSPKKRESMIIEFK